MSDDEIKATNQANESDPKSAPTSVWILNKPFMQDLRRLKELRSFLIREAVPLQATEASIASFGSLNLLRQSFGTGGRQPTEDEWYQLETKHQLLFQHLTEPLRRKFLLGNIPYWVAILPTFFAIIAVVALIVAVTNFSHPATKFISYLFWTISSGAIGSIAFIGMNALSVQQDATFDLNNSKLIVLRVVLGVMFALVLSLPFGYPYYLQFLEALVKLGLIQPETIVQKPTNVLAIQAVFLLLPFILGFSTTLVIMILNRLVEAVQTFFGKTSVLIAPNAGNSSLHNAPHPGGLASNVGGPRASFGRDNN